MTEKETDSQPDLERMRHLIVDACLKEAVFDGWTRKMLDAAAASVGAGALLPILFPKGIGDVLTFWSWREDEKMVDAFKTVDPAPTRIRDKVTFLVKSRIEALGPHREAARRASATLALPIHGHLASRLTWATADAIWRALGDTSTDFNFYTKRASLSAVYLSTLAFWFADEGRDGAPDGEGPENDAMVDPWADSWHFLDQRINAVMQFEKFKAKMRDKQFSPQQFLKPLAKWRYSAGR